MNDKDLIWEEIETKHIIQDEWIDFRESTYRYPDGRTFTPYYSYSRRDYTVIVPPIIYLWWLDTSQPERTNCSIA